MSKAAVQQCWGQEPDSLSLREREKERFFHYDAVKRMKRIFPPHNVTFLLPACTWGPWMSMLLLKNICINPWKEEEDGEGVRFWNDWNIAAAVATGAKGGAGDTRRIFWKTSQAHLSLFRRQVSFWGILLNWAQITRWEQTKDPY